MSDTLLERPDAGLDDEADSPAPGRVPARTPATEAAAPDVPPPAAEDATPARPPLHLATPHLLGRHCLLRMLTPQDAPVLAQLHDDERVQRYQHDVPFDADFWCNGSAYFSWGALSWAITVDREVAGFFTLLPNVSVYQCTAEVGYWVTPSHWGRGIASDALSLVTGWVWAQRPELTRLFATIYAGNLASQRVATKSGYVCEALLPKSVVKNGQPVTCSLYGCYRPD